MEQLTVIKVLLSSDDLLLKVPHTALNLLTPNVVMSKNISQDKSAFNTAHYCRVSLFH